MTLFEKKLDYLLDDLSRKDQEMKRIELFYINENQKLRDQITELETNLCKKEEDYRKGALDYKLKYDNLLSLVQSLSLRITNCKRDIKDLQFLLIDSLKLFDNDKVLRAKAEGVLRDNERRGRDIEHYMQTLQTELVDYKEQAEQANSLCLEGVRTEMEDMMRLLKENHKREIDNLVTLHNQNIERVIEDKNKIIQHLAASLQNQKDYFDGRVESMIQEISKDEGINYATIYSLHRDIEETNNKAEKILNQMIAKDAMIQFCNEEKDKAVQKAKDLEDAIAKVKIEKEAKMGELRGEIKKLRVEIENLHIEMNYKLAQTEKMADIRKSLELRNQKIRYEQEIRKLECEHAQEVEKLKSISMQQKEQLMKDIAFLEKRYIKERLKNIDSLNVRFRNNLSRSPEREIKSTSTSPGGYRRRDRKISTVIRLES